MVNENLSFYGTGVMLVSWDFTKGRDNDLILVGQREPDGLKIVNAFTRQEARDIYKRLVTKMDNQTKSCDNCKFGLGGVMCLHNYELECRDDEYQLWEANFTRND